MYLKTLNLIFGLSLIIFLVACGKDPDKIKEEPIPKDFSGLRLYAATGRLVCIDADKGSKLWAATGYITGNTLPAYDSGVLYTSNLYGFEAFNAQSGASIWKTTYSNLGYSGGNGSISAVSVKDTMIYTIGRSGSSGRTTLYAASKKSGVVKWFKHLVAESTWGALMPNLKIVDSKLIITASDFVNNYGRVIVFDRTDGKLLVDRLISDGFPGDNPESDGALIYVNSRYFSEVSAFDINNGNLVWKKTLPEKADWTMRPVVAGNRLIVKAGRGFYLLNKLTGTDVGKIDAPDGIDAYYIDQESIYYKDYKRDVFCYSFSGQLNWKTPSVLKEEVAKAPVNGLCSFANGVLIGFNDYIIETDAAHCPQPTPVCIGTGLQIIHKKTGKSLARKVTLDCPSEYFIYKGGIVVSDGIAYPAYSPTN